MDLKRNVVRKLVRNTINYPDALGIIACSPPGVLAENDCAVGELFKPIIPTGTDKQKSAILNATEDLRRDEKLLNYKPRFVNEDKCSLGPEITSIIQEMKSLSPREIAELVPRISPRLESLPDSDKERFIGDIEKIVQEDTSKTRWVAIFNLVYILTVTIMMSVVIYLKRSNYDTYVVPNSLPGFGNYWGFAAVNILLAFSTFYFHYRYSFRISDLKTFQFISVSQVASLVFFYLYLTTQEKNYSILAFVTTLVGILFQSSLILNYEDVPGINRLLLHYPNLYEQCSTIQTTTKQDVPTGRNWTEVLVALFTNLIPAIYLAIQYYKIS